MERLKLQKPSANTGGAFQNTNAKTGESFEKTKPNTNTGGAFRNTKNTCKYRWGVWKYKNQMQIQVERLKIQETNVNTCGTFENKNAYTGGAFENTKPNAKTGGAFGNTKNTCKYWWSL